MMLLVLPRFGILVVGADNRAFNKCVDIILVLTSCRKLMCCQVRKGLVELLRSLLERASVNLLYLTATFLKKLSVSGGDVALPPR